MLLFLRSDRENSTSPLLLIGPKITLTKNDSKFTLQIVHFVDQVDVMPRTLNIKNKTGIHA